MPTMRASRLVSAAVLSLTLMLTGTAAASADDPSAPPGTPTATTFLGTPTVGPLFGTSLSSEHSCTASVVASPHGDLLVTAAHCLSGTAVGQLFAPGYHDGVTPYGVWSVVAAYVDPRWRTRQDPRSDYAILRVADQVVGGRTVSVQSRTGANVLDTAPPRGSRITDVAYNGGIGDRPINCTTTVYRTRGFPSFDCHGFVGGSSGSPWLQTVPGSPFPVVRGVIGGLHQGGCYDYTSYSSPFTGRVFGVYLRAVLRTAPDVVPAAGSDGC